MTKPEGNDAADRSVLACPRPAGFLVQLLLVALYMSTKEDSSEPVVDTLVHPQATESFIIQHDEQTARMAGSYWLISARNTQPSQPMTTIVVRSTCPASRKEHQASRKRCCSQARPTLPKSQRISPPMVVHRIICVHVK
jgi:hypothetical protein